MVPFSMSEDELLDSILKRLECQAPKEAIELKKHFCELKEELRLCQERLDSTSRELLKSKKQLNDWEKEKNEMLSVCAHDLKSPMSSVLSFLEILRTGSQRLSPSELLNIYDRMDRGGRHMLALVNDLLDSTRLATGKISLQKEPMLLSHLCKEVVEDSMAKAQAKEIKLQLQVGSGELKVNLDHQKGLQVVNNLVSNALKFTPKGGNVFLKIQTKEHRSILDVMDSGQGIPAEELSDIFQKFQQTSTKATDGEKGSGLGLSIVRQLVEIHDGKISVQSKVGQGTHFIVDFPVIESSLLLKLFGGKK
jgi:signal transduction histidine kinase